METTTDLPEIIARLRGEGYTEAFDLRQDCLGCQGRALRLYATDFAVDRCYRYEGSCDPADERLVCAISSVKYALKGTLVNGYAMYGDGTAQGMVRALHHRPD